MTFDEKLLEGVEKEIRRVHVREDGPDAWGALVTVPAGSFRRFLNDQGQYEWFYLEQEQSNWLELVGSTLEYVKPGRDGVPAEWVQYRAVSWD